MSIFFFYLPIVHIIVGYIIWSIYIFLKMITDSPPEQQGAT